MQCKSPELYENIAEFGFSSTSFLSILGIQGSRGKSEHEGAEESYEDVAGLSFQVKLKHKFKLSLLW